MRARRLAVLAGVAAAVALALNGPSAGDPPTAVPAASATGAAFSHTNSRDGAPLLTAANLAPGDKVAGEVTLTNVGDRGGRFTVTVADLADSAGPSGLAGALRLRVTEPTVAGTLYDGPLAEADAVPVGQLAPGQARTYRLEAALPATADGALAGTSAGFRLVWDAVEAQIEPSDPPTGPVAPPPAAGAPRAGGDGTAEPAVPAVSIGPPRLRVQVPPVQRLAPRRRPLVRARCDRPCRIAVRGALRVGDRRAGLRTWRTRRPRAGLVRPRLGVPRGLRRALRRSLADRRPAARYVLRAAARDRGGRRVTVRLVIRLRAVPGRPRLVRATVVSRRATR